MGAQAKELQDLLSMALHQCVAVHNLTVPFNIKSQTDLGTDENPEFMSCKKTRNVKVPLVRTLWPYMSTGSNVTVQLVFC